MSILKDVPEHADPASLEVKWEEIEDGLKWKTILVAEKHAYMDRKGIEELSDTMYVMICMIDQYKKFKLQAGIMAAHEAVTKQFEIEQASIEATIDSIEIKLK